MFPCIQTMAEVSWGWIQYKFFLSLRSAKKKKKIRNRQLTQKKANSTACTIELWTHVGDFLCSNETNNMDNPYIAKRKDIIPCSNYWPGY